MLSDIKSAHNIENTPQSLIKGIFSLSVPQSETRGKKHTHSLFVASKVMKQALQFSAMCYVPPSLQKRDETFHFKIVSLLLVDISLLCSLQIN